MCFHFEFLALVEIDIIYDGFPDKNKKNYFRKDGDNELVLYDSDAKDGLFMKIIQKNGIKKYLFIWVGWV